MPGVGRTVVAQPARKLKWIIFRVGRLLDEPEGGVEATFVGKENAGISVNQRLEKS